MKYKIIGDISGVVFEEGEVESGNVVDMVREIVSGNVEELKEWWNDYCGVSGVEGIVNEIIKGECDGEYFWNEDSVLVFYKD